MTPLECLTAELEPISAEFSKLTREKRMKISKRVVLTGLAGAATGLSTTGLTLGNTGVSVNTLNSGSMTSFM